ncbi:hypothetical protein HBH56_165030 [Parastagonospora nodorum]|uniref:CENP-V/GFA domain-containing protein n=1 Tax=Phaeosphaeria nodorum (strain SN15 / ATCC MYA-4574 / FGSC 10173) TaxID=321614 RepID=A0A7U2F4B5_PHANO|nr:hypothetical protein HBH56_165030 [Parastagonospora nodorum]QRC98456.1 hypothetical protein JI435_303260 [Parastagonospora nodorum SN15]KAH3936177.1 hypothetical protein HBH54_028120 [Parastagonospora nodorum]KAH3948251.1 hypothetical protein HBH53_102930 [Parastagonospora nodorum]KAH3968585.1 hypothetical protein HBH51_126810 [Parastagonospora nodorum]
MSPPANPFTLAPPSALSQTYTASCHCAAFTYTITTSPPLSHPSARISQCNCSICVKNGYLMIYPANTSVTFLTGSLAEFKSYTFGTNKIAHYFCGTCGASCMARSVDPTFFPDMTCVNVRMFHGGEDVWKGVERRLADGAAL